MIIMNTVILQEDILSPLRHRPQVSESRGQVS